MTGQIILAVGGVVLLVLVGVVVVGAIRRRQRPQFSLRYFLAATMVAAVGLLGGVQWFCAVRAKAEYAAARTQRRHDTMLKIRTRMAEEICRAVMKGNFQLVDEERKRLPPILERFLETDPDVVALAVVGAPGVVPFPAGVVFACGSLTIRDPPYPSPLPPCTADGLMVWQTACSSGDKWCAAQQFSVPVLEEVSRPKWSFRLNVVFVDDPDE
jgi:hypothetical protein